MKITIYTPEPMEFDGQAELTLTIPTAEQTIADLISANVAIQMEFASNLVTQISNVGTINMRLGSMLHQSDGSDPVDGNITIKF